MSNIGLCVHIDTWVSSYSSTSTSEMAYEYEERSKKVSKQVRKGRKKLYQLGCQGNEE